MFNLNELHIVDQLLIYVILHYNKFVCVCVCVCVQSQPFTVESVAAACRKSKSSKRFRQTIKFIQRMNRRVDSSHVSDPEYHFDNEKFAEGRRIITRGLEIIKASNKEMNFEAARERLGEITHPLQVLSIICLGLVFIKMFLQRVALQNQNLRKFIKQHNSVFPEASVFFKFLFLKNIYLYCKDATSRAF